MNILIVYATFSNSTALATQLVAEELTKNSHTVTVKKIRDADMNDFAHRDLIVIASPSWLVEGKEGQPHDDYFAAKERFTQEAFKGKKFAIMGMGDSTYAHFCGAVDYLQEWVQQMTGEVVVPPLCIDGFYFDQDKNSAVIRQWADTLSKKMQQS